MNLLEMLLGNSQTKEGFKDFLNRFEEGLHGKAMVIRKFWNVMEKSPTRYLLRIINRQPVMPSDTSPRQIERSSASC